MYERFFKNQFETKSKVLSFIASANIGRIKNESIGQITRLKTYLSNFEIKSFLDFLFISHPSIFCFSEFF